jgi:neutral ceramidase
MGKHLLLAAVLALAIGPAPASAGEPEWKVGLAQIKVTPEQPVLLSGYPGRPKPFDRVAQDLYVKALVLEDNAGHRGVIVTSDLLGFPAAVAEPICERIQKQTGLQRDQILINSSHTHAGPVLSLKIPGADAPGEAFRTVEYTRKLQDKVVEVVLQASKRLEAAQLSWGSGVIDFAMSRREFTPDGIILGVNARGLADRSVPVLRIAGADNKLLAVLFGAATHGTTLTGTNYELCGDYAGFAQALVQERYPTAQAMFMLGCAGDSNPYPRGTMELTKKHGKSLSDEVCRVLDGKLRKIAGPLRLAFGRVDLPLEVPSREELQKIATAKRNAKSSGAQEMLAMLDRGEKLADHYTCPVTVWQFGKDLTLVGLSGEVVVDYVPLLEKALGPNQLWLAAYCNDVFGYLPSTSVLSEGGYETRGLYSGGAGFFDPRAEAVLVHKVRELADKVRK